MTLCDTGGKGRKRGGMLLAWMCIWELMPHTGVGELSWAVRTLYLASTTISVLCFVLGATVCRADAAIFLIYLSLSLACFSRILSSLLSYPLLSCFTAHCSTLCYLHHHNKISVRIADRAGVEVQDDDARSRWKHKLEAFKAYYSDTQSASLFLTILWYKFSTILRGGIVVRA